MAYGKTDSLKKSQHAPHFVKSSESSTDIPQQLGAQRIVVICSNRKMYQSSNNKSAETEIETENTTKCILWEGSLERQYHHSSYVTPPRMAVILEVFEFVYWRQSMRLQYVAEIKP